MRRFPRASRGLLALVAGALLTAGCGGQGGAAQGEGSEAAPEAIAAVLGTAGEREFDNMPFLIAEQEGYFEEEGLDLEIVHFSGGGGDLVSGFASDRVDFGFTSFASALRGMAQGVPIKIVAETSTYPVFWGLIVPADSPIQSVDDLEAGDRIAITSEGGLTHYVSLLILAEAGLEPSDVTLVPLGVARYVVSLQDLLPAFTFAGVIASETAIAEKPDAVERLLRAYQRGLDWMEENPEESVAFIEAKYEMQPEIAQQLYDAGMENFNRSGEVNVEGLEYVLSTSAEYGFLDQPMSVDEVADTSFTPVE